MSESTRRVLLSCLVIIGIACLCTAILSLIGIGILNTRPTSPLSQTDPTDIPTLVSQVDSPPASPTPSQVDRPTETPTTPGEIVLAPESTSTPTEEAFPPEISQEMDQIQKQVIQIRGLQSTSPVTRSLLTKGQLEGKIKTDLLEDYTQQDALNDARLYSSLGLLDPQMDFYQYYQKLLGEQIAGYYDDETKQMYVIQETGFNGTERFTYAHEYEHTLQDQNYGLGEGLNIEDETCQIETDRCQATLALVEGDATLASLDWLSKYATKKDIQDILMSSQDDMPIFNKAPVFLQKDFLFPYQQGQVFVQSLFDEGGWQAINRAFQDPPVSTEQILHPSHYPGDKPIQVNLPELGPALGSGWQKVKEMTLGEWYLYLMLADGRNSQWKLTDSKAQNAAAGWGGDVCEVYTNQQNQTVLILRTQWDDANEAKQFATAFQDYAVRRFGSQPQNQTGVLSWNGKDEYSLFELNGDQATWVLAPDQAIGSVIWQAIQD